MRTSPPLVQVHANLSKSRDYFTLHPLPHFPSVHQGYRLRHYRWVGFLFSFLGIIYLQGRFLRACSACEPPSLLAPGPALPVCSELEPPPRRDRPGGYALEISKGQEARLERLPLCRDDPAWGYGARSAVPAGLGGG